MKLFYLMMQVLIEVNILLLLKFKIFFLFCEDYLHQPLQRFIETLPVRTILLKNEKRLGLISSRVKGYLEVCLFSFLNFLFYFSCKNCNRRNINVFGFSC
jgi:hypothetical protein